MWVKVRQGLLRQGKRAECAPTVGHHLPNRSIGNLAGLGGCRDLVVVKYTLISSGPRTPRGRALC